MIYLFLRAENTHERNDTRNPVGWRHTKALLLKQQKVILYHLEIEITIGIAVFWGDDDDPRGDFYVLSCGVQFRGKKDTQKHIYYQEAELEKWEMKSL